MATLDTVTPTVTYADNPAITSVAGTNLDQDVDKSTNGKDLQGILTFYQIKTSSQANYAGFLSAGTLATEPCSGESGGSGGDVTYSTYEILLR